LLTSCAGRPDSSMGIQKNMRWLVASMCCAQRMLSTPKWYVWRTCHLVDLPTCLAYNRIAIASSGTSFPLVRKCTVLCCRYLWVMCRSSTSSVSLSDGVRWSKCVKWLSDGVWWCRVVIQGRVVRWWRWYRWCMMVEMGQLVARWCMMV
jgi:hypothetical protein